MYVFINKFMTRNKSKRIAMAVACCHPAECELADVLTLGEGVVETSDEPLYVFISKFMTRNKSKCKRKRRRA